MPDLIPNINGHVLKNAVALSHVAAEAYKGDEGVSNLLRKWPEVRRFQNGSAEGVVCWDDDRNIAVIGIAGTNDSFDTMLDLDCNRSDVQVSGCEYDISVHSGFLRYAEMATNGIKLLRVMSHLKGKTLFITGHSLGGAAAILAPLLEEDLKPYRIFTFGAPRTICSSDVFDYPFDVIHFRRTMDVVPDVPLRPNLLRFLRFVSGFSHPGREVWINDGGVDTEANQFRRRFQRRCRYAYATVQGMIKAAFMPHRPVSATRVILGHISKVASEDHTASEYFNLIWKHNGNRIARRI